MVRNGIKTNNWYFVSQSLCHNIKYESSYYLQVITGRWRAVSYEQENVECVISPIIFTHVEKKNQNVVENLYVPSNVFSIYQLLNYNLRGEIFSAG